MTASTATTPRRPPLLLRQGLNKPDIFLHTNALGYRNAIVAPIAAAECAVGDLHSPRHPACDTASDPHRVGIESASRQPSSSRLTQVGQ